VSRKGKEKKRKVEHFTQEIHQSSEETGRKDLCKVTVTNIELDVLLVAPPVEDSTFFL
jgi:hypothetical protein